MHAFLCAHMRAYVHACIHVHSVAAPMKLTRSGTLQTDRQTDRQTDNPVHVSAYPYIYQNMYIRTCRNQEPRKETQKQVDDMQDPAKNERNVNVIADEDAR